MIINKKLILISLILSILILIPTSFAASDNTTDIVTSDDCMEIVSESNAIYVAVDGNDSYDGSSQKPLATISNAIDRASESGSNQIYITQGRYNEYSLNIAQDLTITGLGNVIIDANGNGRIFKITGEYNVKLENLNLTGGIGAKDVYDESGVYDGGGAVYIQDSTVEMVNMTFSNNWASMNGGAVAWQGPNARIINSTFTGNYAGYLGGAIDFEDDNAYIENSYFESNQAQNGGAIFMSFYAWVINVVGSTFYKNVAEYGGAILIESNQQLKDNFIRNCNFTKNEGDEYGGAVFLDNRGFESCSSWTQMINNIFVDNFADAGGALSSYWANMEVRNNNFINNSASYGGAVASSGNLYVLSNTMTGNKAEEVGSEIYNVGTYEGYLNLTLIDGKTINVSTPSVTLNATVTDDMGNKISGSSVIFYIGGSQTLISPSVLTEGLCTVVYAPRQNGTFTVSGSYSSSSPNHTNIKVGYINVVNASADYYGIIYLSDEYGSDENIGSESSPVKSFDVAYALASRSGGSNTIYIKKGTYAVSRYVISQSFTIIGEDNPILDGEYSATIFSLEGDGKTYFNFTGITFANGQSVVATTGTSTHGGAIYMMGGYLYLKDVVFVNNTAADYGGAIHVNKGFNNGATSIGQATVINCTFENNIVTANDGYATGGAISVYDADLIIINSTFTDNCAKYGGAIGLILYGGTLKAYNTTFINNYAVKNGGAVHADSVANQNPVFIYNCTFISNNGVNGGAAYFGRSTIDKSTFINNTAEENAGAFITAGNVEITNNIFINNTAKQSGGAILINQNPSQVFPETFVITLENNTITGCSADWGDEIYLFSDLNVTGLKITFLDNMTKFYMPGTDTEIYAFITDDNGNLITAENFTFTINGVDFESYVIDGVSAVDYTISFSDNNAIVTGSLASAASDVETYIGIIKIATGEIMVEFENTTGVMGENKSIRVYVIDEDGNPINGGYVNVDFEGDEFKTPIKDGIANVTLSLPDSIGLYKVTVQYTNISTTRYVNVTKANPNIKIQVSNIKVGDIEYINITLADKTTGSVTINVNSKDYTVNIKNGFAGLNVSGLANGNYVVKVTYDGDERYTASTASQSFIVSKVSDYKISITQDKAIVGENATVYVTIANDAKGSVDLTINGKKYTSTIRNGIATFSIPDLKIGRYAASATFNGDDKYESKTSSGYVDISKVSDYGITLIASTIREGDNATITISLPEDATGNVKITVKNNTYSSSIVNGSAVFNIAGLDEGVWDIDVSYDGDSKYEPQTTKSNITVEPPVNVVLRVDDVTKYFGGSQRLVIYLTDNKGNPLNNLTVYAVINGNQYSKDTANGRATFPLNLNSGNYTVQVMFNGSGVYDKISANASVIIKASVEGSDLVKMYRNASRYSAKFIDTNGELIKNTTVRFNINGIYYNRTTNANGIANLNINLGQGKYVITAINPLTGEMFTNNITVLPTIIENNDVVMYYKNGTQYLVKLLDSNGNVVGKGVNVTFNINGMIYTRSTNANGIARLNINLQPSDYIITAEYLGCRVSNNIKVLPVLSAQNLTMNYQDGSRFEAKLVDGSGNALKGKKITFNVNGMIYERTTDIDGIARLNINLISGKYIITSSYNGSNIANTITIS